jgi:hypothetical protein
MNQTSFMYQPIKIIIDTNENLREFKVSVAFKSSKNRWSAKFKDFEKFPSEHEVNQTIKRGFPFEKSGAKDKFNLTIEEFEKSFN